MNRMELLQLLEEKGLLSKEDNFTIAGGNEAASISLRMPHMMILRDCLPEDEKILAERILTAYREDTTILIMSHGNILLLTAAELAQRSSHDKEILLFDSRKALLKPAAPYSLYDLSDTVHTLLAPGGCPWDRAQSHETLRTYFIQEVYEVVDAIDRGDMKNLKEELGDVLFQILFHAALAEKEGYFTMQDVADGIKDKMIRRHPFVFDKNDSDSSVSGPQGWEKRKRIEKNRKYLMSGVPKSLPSLLLTCIIQKKVSSNGLQEAFAPGDLPADIKKQISRFLEDDREMNREKKAGAFLFSLVHYLQENGIEPELALHHFAIDFMRWFCSFEDYAIEKGTPMTDLSPEKTLQLWKDFISENPFPLELKTV